MIVQLAPRRIGYFSGSKSKNFISQAFEFIQFGVYVNFYLSMLYKINPAPLPWVDYFKVKLGQPLGIKKPDF